MASVAGAQGPSFDCSKAKGQVPALICKDPGLAKLDRQLDGVYKAAMAKARSEQSERGAGDVARGVTAVPRALKLAARAASGDWQRNCL